MGQESQIQPVVVYQGSGPFVRFIQWLGWMAFGLCFLVLISFVIAYGDYFDTSEGVSEKFHSGSETGGDKIAVISVEGAIMEGDGFVKRQIDKVREDDSVRAVVLRVDSPGGTITGSDFIYHHLKKLREEKKLPIVVSMGSMAASGGYYVAMAVGDQEKSIYAEPTCITGSIGVIVPHYDVSGLLARLDVKDDSIASHERKQMLSMTKPVSPEHRQLIQGYVDESFGRFKEIVKSGRPAFAEDGAKLDELATGEIFSAEKAQKVGLVDELGFLEDAVDRAIELANLDKENVRVVKYKRPDALFDLSGGMASMRSQGGFGHGADLQALLELSTPRGYYLVSSLPLLSSSGKRAD